jgi:CDP-glucose 4,6-dehydratase
MQTKILKKYLAKNFWSNKTVLITGINGFIGGNLAKKLISLNANVIGISNRKLKNKFLFFEGIEKSLKFHKIDIKDYSKIQKILELYKIDVCFHLAAQVDVNIAKVDPYLTFESNVKGTYNLLENLRKHKSIKSIILASSDKAYGEYKISDLPYKEDYDLRPIYPYDVSKAAGDMIAKSYATDLFKLPVIITRFANIYGPGQLNFTALIPDCILANIGYRKFIPRGNGTNKRDFLYVDDVCDLYLCLSYNLYKNKNLRGEVFNAGTGHGYTVNEIVQKVCSIYGNNELYKKISKAFVNKSLTGEIQHQFMTYKKLNKYFKWKPQHKLEDGLRETIDWYKRFLKKYKYETFIEDKKL